MIKVNAIGDSCPIPVIKTKNAMKEMTGPDTIEVLVDNEIAVQNVTKMAQSSGGKGDIREGGGERVPDSYCDGGSLCPQKTVRKFPVYRTREAAHRSCFFRQNGNAEMMSSEKS